MINVRTIRNLTNNDGLTLRAGRVIRYKTGWQDTPPTVRWRLL